LEREYAGDVHNKPAYKCSDCGSHVMPPKKQTIDRRLSVEEHLDHEAAGRDVRDHKDRNATTIYHPPKMVKEGKRVDLEHGAVTAEMVPSKDTRTGKTLPGKCPDCHTKTEGTSKAFDPFDDVLLEGIEKSILRHGSSHTLDWSHQFAGTPHHLEALQCLRDQLDIDSEYAKHRKDKKSWDEIDKLPGPEREAYHDECDKKRKKIEAREHKLTESKHALERKLVDHHIAEAKRRVSKAFEEFGKPMARREGESSNEFMSRTIKHLMEDKGYDQKQAVAAAYDITGHPKAGKPVKKSIPLILTV
jgi:hypothetical protein